MADNYVTDAGSGGNTYFSDDIGGTHAPLIKIMLGNLDANDGPVSATNPMPIDIQEINGTAISIGGGAEAGALLVTIANDSTGVVSVDDGGANLSVDWGGTVPPIGAGTEAAALRVTVATDSTGVLSVDDNAASLTVDAPVGTPVNVQIGDGTDTALVNAAGELLVDEPNTVSANNSTTATLGISGNFTGTADDISNFSAITIQVDASHDSATDGMTFEFSTDNTNWDDTYLFTYTAADGARRFQFPATAQYFRVNYTNGGTGQTHFRLQTILHRHPVTSSVHRAVSSMDPDRSVQAVKSIIMAQAGGAGDFVPVQASAGGNFKIDLEELAGTAVSVNTGTADAGTQRVTVATDDVVSVDWNGTAPPIGAGLEATALRVTVATDSTGVLSVDDNGANLSVDWAGTVPPIGAGTEAAALRVTLATDSTGLVSVDDNGNALTVDAANDGSLVVQIGDGTSLATVRNLAANDALNVAIVDGSGGQITSFGGGTQYTEDDAAAANPVGTTPVLVRLDTPATITDTDGDVVAQRATNYGAAYVQIVTSSGSFVDSFGGGTEYTEDVATPADPVGKATMLRREDAPVTIAVDGDWVAQNATQYGAAYCQIVDSSGNFIDTFGGSGGTAMADDAAFTVGTTQFTPAGGTYRSVRDLVDDNDAGAFAMNQRRGMFVTLEDSSSNAVTVTSNRLEVDGSGVTQPISAASLPLPTGAATSANQLPDGHNVTVDNATAAPVPTRMSDGAALYDLPPECTDGAAHGASQLGVRVMGTDGTNDQQIAVDATGNVQVDIVADAAGLATAANQLPDGHNVTIDNAAGGSAVNIQDGGNNISIDWAGTVPPIGAGTEAAALRVTVATDSTGVLSVDYAGSVPTISNAAMQVTGDEAHDAPDAGNPLKIGGYASTNEPTAVAAADRVNAWFDTFGRLVTVGGHANPETPVTVTATASGDTAVIGTPGAGVSLHIVKGSVHNAGGTAQTVRLQENGSATDIWEADLAPDGGGSLFNFGERGWKLTANTGLDVNCESAGTIYVNVTEYYIAA